MPIVFKNMIAINQTRSLFLADFHSPKAFQSRDHISRIEEITMP